MAFHSNLETDYDPDFLDLLIKNAISPVLENPRQKMITYLESSRIRDFFCYLIALEGESKLIQITNSENSNQNLFGFIFSIIFQQHIVDYCLILTVR